MDKYKLLENPQDEISVGGEHPQDKPMQQMTILETDNGYDVPKKRIGCERALCMVTIACMFVIVGLVVSLVVVLTKEPAYGRSCESPECGVKAGRTMASMNLCESPECVVKAGRTMASMNTEAAPCEDFYEYACGSFEKNTQITPDKNVYSTMNMMAAVGQIYVSRLLEETGDGELNGNSTAVGKARDFYKSCMSYSATHVHDTDPTMFLVNDMGGLPVLTGSSWNSSSWRMEDTLIKSYLLGLSPVMAILLEPDMKDSTLGRISIKQNPNQFILGDYGLYSGNQSSNIEHAYKKFFVRIATLLGATQSNALSAANDLWDFERTLAQAYEPQATRTNTNKNYHLMTLDDFQAKVINGAIDFHYVLNSMLGSTTKIDGREKVQVLAISYLRRAAKVLQAAKSDPQVLANYLVFHSLMPFIAEMPLEFGIAKQELMKAMDRVSGQPQDWQRCVDHTTAAAGFAVGALYVAGKFSDDDRKETTQVLRVIRDTFTQRLLTMDWMDNQTLTNAVDKANDVQQMIGYPDFIKDPAKLDAYYSNWTVDPLGTSFVMNMYHSRKFLMKQHLLQLRKPFNHTEWLMEPSRANAYYNHQFNEIVFPAGILQPPMYDPGTPKAIMFGSIGTVMGHELTHAFDNTNRLYDEKGNLHDWWTPSSVQNFENRTQCLVEQYNKSEVAPGVFLDGLTTLGENIADNGGLKVSHAAWREYLRVNPSYDSVLPGVNLTQEQLFFLGFGQLWCTYYTPQYAVQSVLIDKHSNARFRVINTLRNTQAFSDAYQCEPGSGMNPSHKCEVW